MTGSFSPLSQSDLAQRRQQLRRQRRVRFLQTAWRALAVCGLAGGAVWVVTLPVWLIQKPEQVKIEGNHLLQSQMIRSLLPISYPQSLLRLEPQAIAKELMAKAPIADVVVSRQLFPPSLTVRIKERYPVAIALLSQSDLQYLYQKTSRDKGGVLRAWLLDENGLQIQIENYEVITRSMKLPDLKIIGNFDHYHAIWPQLYRETSRSPVKITEIDIQNPANIVLKTELGIVHLGSFGPRFPEQIKTLDRMRKLPNQISPSQIEFINLRNPASPTLQMIPSREAPKEASKVEESVKSDSP
ncbi:MAG: cell division protein FtsQ/DivIB [Leptodesmis sp.]|uniref:cell division protein FtsQ/DivIB n=1 Tax=Leptodesmis TaxID=2664261 RepID=UPI001F21B9F2|nr:FtsQ-type POTRA domain-containing protein [Leptodesmis sichuanensis]UIE36704.1 FtsQ-type POTRA domain-containing protein [Leptodesmis sichuanensis A121]